MVDGRNALVLLALASGCYTDLASSNGELGRLQYTLGTDYESGADELTDLLLLTRHEVWITVSATASGEEDADGELGLVTHRSDDARVDAEPTSDAGSAVPGFGITADGAGPVVVESTLDGQPFDRITLQFADPTGLELVTWVRAPWADEWTSAPGTDELAVEAGSQLSFLAIPVAGEERLAGEFTPAIDVDAPDLVVPDELVWATQEGGVTSSPEPVTFYAVGPGTVTFTLSDPEHGLDVGRAVTITP